MRITRTVLQTTVRDGDKERVLYGNYSPVTLAKKGMQVVESKMVKISFNLEDITHLAKIEEVEE